MSHALARIDTFPLATDFSPAEPLGGHMRVVLLLIGGLLVSATAAATLIPIAGAVIGTGQIDAESRVKTVAHPVGGTIAEILVHNGQHVSKGQALLRLDDKVSSSDARVASLSVVQLRARKARLEAEVAGAGAIAFPADLLVSTDPATRNALTDERNQLAASRAEEASQDAQATARAAEYEQQIAGYRTQIAALDAQTRLIKPEREAMATLYAKKLVTVTRYNQIERTAADISGNIATLGTEISGARARIAEARSQIGQTRAARRGEAGDKLAQVNDLLGQQQARTVTATDIQDRSVIRAPYDGVVDKLAFSTIGGVIRPAEPILAIVPDRDRPVVSAAIRPDDVDRVAVGQTVRVRLTAFSVTATPEVTGRVTYVSASRVTDPETHQPFYDVRVAIDPAALRASGVTLRSGMPAELFIGTGSRSMLSYLTKPLTDQFNRAFRDD